MRVVADPEALGSYRRELRVDVAHEGLDAVRARRCSSHGLWCCWDVHLDGLVPFEQRVARGVVVRLRMWSRLVVLLRQRRGVYIRTCGKMKEER